MAVKGSPESQAFERLEDALLGGVFGELRHYIATSVSAANASSYGRFDVQHILSEGFDVEADGGFDVGHRLLIAIAFADHHAFQPQRISHVTIGVLLDNDLERLRWRSIASPLALALVHAFASTIRISSSVARTDCMPVWTIRAHLAAARCRRCFGRIKHREHLSPEECICKRFSTPTMHVQIAVDRFMRPFGQS
jgi:hypothetical protein